MQYTIRTPTNGIISCQRMDKRATNRLAEESKNYRTCDAKDAFSEASTRTLFQRSQSSQTGMERMLADRPNWFSSVHMGMTFQV